MVAFARERGLTVRRNLSGHYVIEVPKGELRVEVLLENSRRITEWFPSAHDAVTGEELWSDWFDHYAAIDPSKEQFEEMGEYMIGFLEAVLLAPQVRIAHVVREPVFRLFGRGWLVAQGMTLQLLIDGKWIEWADAFGQ